MKSLLSFSVLLLSLNVAAQEQTIKKEKWHWNNTTQNNSAGYAQVVKVDNVLYISGAVASEVTAAGIDKVYKPSKNR